MGLPCETRPLGAFSPRSVPRSSVLISFSDPPCVSSRRHSALTRCTTEPNATTDFGNVTFEELAAGACHARDPRQEWRSHGFVERGAIKSRGFIHLASAVTS